MPVVTTTGAIFRLVSGDAGRPSNITGEFPFAVHDALPDDLAWKADVAEVRQVIIDEAKSEKGDATRLHFTAIMDMKRTNLQQMVEGSVDALSPTVGTTATMFDNWQFSLTLEPYAKMNTGMSSSQWIRSGQFWMI